MRHFAFAAWLRASLIAVCLGIVAAIAVYGLVRFDMAISVEHRLGTVREVHGVAGGDASERLFVTDLGDYARAIRVSDWMIRTEVGENVCVQKLRLLVRNWSRHRITFPRMCRAMQ